MKNRFIIFFILISTSIAASGKKELPINYVYVSPLDLTKNKVFDEIFLPYWKPEGINKIITSSVHGLIIEKIFVDNRIIYPKRNLFNMGAYDNYINEKEVDRQGGQYLMPMRWRTNYGSNKTYDDYLNEGIYFDYFSRNGKIKYSPDKYHIPYGSKEVYILYKIRIPDYSLNNQFMSYITTETYIAKFNIIWPEIRIADRNGKILTPTEYSNLGLYKINTNKRMIIELPVLELNPIFDQFNPIIDNRWITIYQLIGDGILINEQRITINERNNIDKLIQHDGLRENNRTIGMIWITNDKIENGITFYSITKNPPIKYNIPYGTKEIFMIYDILFHETVGYSNYNKRLCVKWEIEWN